MLLSKYVSDKRSNIFENLVNGINPQEGLYHQAEFDKVKSKGTPQMGAVRYSPHTIFLEFIYSDIESNTIFIVELKAPERIVFLPVPNWVIESIWQGEIIGSYHFEKEAFELVDQFTDQLLLENNQKLFDQQPAKRRE